MLRDVPHSRHQEKTLYNKKMIIKGMIIKGMLGEPLQYGRLKRTKKCLKWTKKWLKRFKGTQKSDCSSFFIVTEQGIEFSPGIIGTVLYCR